MTDVRSLDLLSFRQAKRPSLLESVPLAAEVVDLRPHPDEQQFGGCGGEAYPLQHPDLALLRAELSTHARDFVPDPVELHRTLRSSGTSPNFRISLASLKSPDDGSPVGENAMAPAWPRLREPSQFAVLLGGCERIAGRLHGPRVWSKLPVTVHRLRPKARSDQAVD